MAEFVKKRFVHLTHASNSRTLFANAETYADATDYYTLTGSTAEDAEFVDFSGNDLQGYTIIPTTAVVFVDFPDGTTGIISHMKFYSKLDELGGGATPANPSIRVLDGYDDFPTTSNTDLNIQRFSDYWFRHRSLRQRLLERRRQRPHHLRLPLARSFSLAQLNRLGGRYH